MRDLIIGLFAITVMPMVFAIVIDRVINRQKKKKKKNDR